MSRVTTRMPLFLSAAMACLLAVVDAQPRRGPPRSVGEDKSTFFGKEGEQVQDDSSLNLYISLGLVGILVAAVVYALAGSGGKSKTR